MVYLAEERSRQRRADPRCILNDCRSIVVLGIRYPNPISFSETKETGALAHGRVASYAWGNDYHTVLQDRLLGLVSFIEKEVAHPITSRSYSDTGPLLERELAQRAGLGWIGKNTCLISPTQGSYHFLAEILLDIELTADEPFTADMCGTCTRCVQSCPTGCILPNRVIDARRCISYHTIESIGSIPAELRPLFGNWVFGCDICQIVCPWNRFAEGEVDPAFTPTADLPTPNLVEEITLSVSAFKHKYRNSPILRAKTKGYLRNVAVALGNSRDGRALKALEEASRDIEPLVREHAEWAIRQITQ
jgi:epoxyqueuosine reductase